MNIKKFSDAMNEIDSKYIEEALSYKRSVKKYVRIKWAAAACIVGAVSVAIVSGLVSVNRQGGGFQEEAQEAAAVDPDDSMAGAADGTAGGVQSEPVSGAVHIDMSDITLNEIESYGAGDAALHDPDTDIEDVWDMADIIEYFGRDITPAYIPEGLTAAENNGTAAVYVRPDGSLSEDTVYLRFYSGYYADGSPELTDGIPAGKGVSVIASKTGMPRDCVYASPDSEVKASDIAGTEVIFGHYSLSYGPYDEETKEPAGYYDMYTAEFELEGAKYQIVAEQLPAEELIKVAASLITGTGSIEVE